MQASLKARQRESRKLYWCAIGCFAAAIIFCALSLMVYQAGFIAWVLPLRVVAIIAIAGYIAFALASKAKYQPKPAAKASWKRYWASRLILLLIILAVIVAFLMQPTV